MSSAARGIAVLAAVIAAVFVGRMLRQRSTPLVEPTPTIAAPTENLARGELVYLTHCAKCHGPDGHGDGEAAEKLRPPPRDFAKRPWRFEPTAEAIRKVVRDGIPGTAMVAAKDALSDSDLAAVTAYVLQLSQTNTAAQQTDEFAKLLRAAEFAPVPPRPSPPLTVVDANGATRSLADERGRWVILNFWGTSCESCLRAMPALQRVAEARREQGVVVLPVCADTDDIREATIPAEKIAPGFAVYVDDSGLGPHRFEVKVLPTTWLINPQGDTIAVAHGMHAWESPATTALLDALRK